MSQRRPSIGLLLLSKLLPGDHIHHQAPSLNKRNATAKDEALDAAKRKQMRKAERRKREAGGS